jgi:hypothetical protein
MSNFVFSIDSAVWSSQDPHYSYPITNTGGSFTNLTTSFVVNGSTTIVTISWDSYTNLSSSDGLLFNTNVPYYSEPSINITQFGGIALPVIHSLSSAAFYNFHGQITATDQPTIPSGVLSDYYATDKVLGTVPLYLITPALANSFTKNTTITFSAPPPITPDPSTFLSSGYSATDLKAVGYQASDLFTANYAVHDLSGVFTVKQIVSAGYDISTLYNTGYQPLDLSGTFTTSQIVALGYPINTLIVPVSLLWI